MGVPIAAPVDKFKIYKLPLLQPTNTSFAEPALAIAGLELIAAFSGCCHTWVKLLALSGSVHSAATPPKLQVIIVSPIAPLTRKAAGEAEAWDPIETAAFTFPVALITHVKIPAFERL